MDSGYWRQGDIRAILRINYPRGSVSKLSPDPEREKWIKFKTDYWAGETGYLEITTNRDHPEGYSQFSV